MEEKPFIAVPKSSDSRGSATAGPQRDVRDLWSSATLSQPRANASLSEVCENFDDEGRAVGKIRKSHGRSVSLKDKVHFYPEALEENEAEAADGRVEEGPDGPPPETEKTSSVLSIGVWKHEPHRAYWEEQQNRLPLPLMEVMENEALEILTKALKSYRSRIGKEHFMTKELQRYIEGLQKRRNKRLHCASQ